MSSCIISKGNVKSDKLLYSSFRWIGTAIVWKFNHIKEQPTANTYENSLITLWFIIVYDIWWTYDSLYCCSNAATTMAIKQNDQRWRIDKWWLIMFVLFSCTLLSFDKYFFCCATEKQFNWLLLIQYIHRQSRCNL